MFRTIFSFRRARRQKEAEIQQRPIIKAQDPQALAAQLLVEAKREAVEIRKSTEQELRSEKRRLAQLEERLVSREDRLGEKIEELEKKANKLREKAARVQKLEEKLTHALEETAGVSVEEASQRIIVKAEERSKKQLGDMEERSKKELVRRARQLETTGREKLDRKANEILASVVQRYAASHVSENSTTVVHLPNDNLKGRIIGKEGRNIKVLENVTGCEIIVDETPETIIISGFSLIRRHVAKRAIEKLIQDGRIQPARIEDVVASAKKEVAKMARDAGEEVVYDLGITDFHPNLIQLVGRLKFRTSYSQNVLQHSWEAARIATMLAEELCADVNVVKRATLLHDIGKAVDHEVEGTHVKIGRNIMKKFNIAEPIIKAAESHHEDYPYETIEAIIVQTADAISSSRPGARRENYEQYINRMEDLERLAESFDGVEKAYAIAAGREVRVFVRPDKVDDAAAITCAQELAQRIERELQYPGEVTVNVIRELRSSATAK